MASVRRGPRLSSTIRSEVRRLGRLLGGQGPHELVLVLETQVVVEAPLEADGRVGLAAHVRATAQRAAYVPRPHLDEVL